MEIGRGHFQGSVEACSHGATPTIREVANQGEAQFSSAIAIEAGVHPGCNLCPWSGSRFHSFVFTARGFTEGQGHVWEAPEPSPGGREEPQRGGRGSESEGRTIGGSPPDAEAIEVALETARGQCRALPVGECLDSCLKFVERAKGRDLQQQIAVQAAQELLVKQSPLPVQRRWLGTTSKSWLLCVEKWIN